MEIKFIAYPSSSFAYISNTLGVQVSGSPFPVNQLNGYLHNTLIPQLDSGRYYMGIDGSNGNESSYEIFDVVDETLIDLTKENSLAATNNLIIQEADRIISEIDENETNGLIGPGAFRKTITVLSSGVAISDVEVWISQNADGSNVIAGTLKTDVNGLVTFRLDPGTYYSWANKKGFNFNNPTLVEVTNDGN